MAQTYYIDTMNGDDSKAGTSWANRWKTYAHAGAVMVAGDELLTAQPSFTPPLQNIYREYTTLARVKAQRMPQNVSTQDDALLYDMIRDVCQIIETQTGFAFYPYMETRKFDALRDVDGYQLLFDRRALEITQVTNAGIGTIVSPTSYVTDPRNETPYFGITLLRSSGIVWYFNVDPENALTVTAIWGYHKRYSDAWIAKYTLATSMDASTTILPAIVDPGELLKVDTEFMYARQASLVARGVNGSTAATHDSGATVYAWSPNEGIEQLAREAAVLKIIMRLDPTAVTVTIDGQAFSVPKHIEAFIAERLRGLGFAARVG